MYCTLIRLLRHSCSHRVIFPDVVGCRCSNFFFQLLTLLSWSNWEPKRGHARRGKRRGKRGGRRGEKLQSHSHKMMGNLEKNKTEMGANKMMMDESSPLATLGEHIAKLSSLGKANGYGKCKDRLPKYLCSWSRLYTLPYRSLPYIYFLRGRTGTDHLFPRRDTTYLPSSTSAPPASPWRSYYVSFFHSISIST